MHIILGAKPDDHKHLFEEVSKAEAEGRVTTLRWTDDTKKEEVQCEIRFGHGDRAGKPPMWLAHG